MKDSKFMHLRNRTCLINLKTGVIVPYRSHILTIRQRVKILLKKLRK